jgi:DNA replication protein DnaC
MTPATALPLDALAQQLTTLGLEHAADALPELLATAARERLDPGAFLGRLLTRQLERKDERRITTMLTLSGLPSGKTLEDFDWTFQPKADCRQLDALVTCSVVRERQNILFLGPPGVGKSHLSCSLGVKAIKNGFSVMHIVLDDLLHALTADAAIPPRRLKGKRYLSTALLIIDEVGIRPLDRVEANLFFRLISARHERASIISSPPTNTSATGPRSLPATRSSPPTSSIGCCITCTSCTSTGAATACASSINCCGRRHPRRRP